MAEHVIDKFTYGGNTYKLQDNESGYLTNAVTSLNSKTGAVTITGTDGITVTADANTDTVTIEGPIGFSDTDDQMWVNWKVEEAAIYGQQTQSVTYSFAIHMDDNKTKLTSATLARSYNGADWDILGTLHPISSFSNSFVPIGTILDFAGSTAPTGYLICDGSAVSRTTYSDLFTVIGTTWGAGDGSTTFNLPNLCGRATIGVGTGTATDATAHTLGDTNGTETHLLTANESGIHEHNHADTLTFKLPNHAHGLANSMIVYNNASSNTSRMATNGSGTKISVNTNIGLNTENPTSLSNCTKSGSVTKHNGADATTSHNNMQPYATVNKIIKAL